MSESDDYVLFKAVRNGSKTALSTLFLRYHPVLRAHGLKMTQDSFHVEESIQELFLYLFERSDGLGDVQNVKTYLMKSFRRRLIRKQNESQRRQIQREAAGEFLNITYREADLEKEVHQKQLLLEILNDLSPRQKEAIHLRYYAGFTTAEIAEVMQVADQTILNTLYQALRKIRKNRLLDNLYP